MISRWIRPIIAGLLLNVMLTMIYQNMQTGAGLDMNTAVVLLITAVIFIADMWLLNVKKKSNGLLIAISAVAGIVMCNIVL